jgi:hypothetical protein
MKIAVRSSQPILPGTQSPPPIQTPLLDSIQSSERRGWNIVGVAVYNPEDSLPMTNEIANGPPVRLSV